MRVLNLSLIFPSVYALITLPSQLGPYPITITDNEVLTPRLDPLSPTNSTRRLMTTLYYPVLSGSCTSRSTIPYISPAVGAAYAETFQSYGLTNTTLSQLELANCASSVSDSPSVPILILSPGLPNSRLLYRAIATALASSGYAVLALDHTYEAVAIEFPSGEVVRQNLPSLNTSDPSQLEPLLEIRVDDVSDLLDYIEAGSYPGLESRGSQDGEELRVGAFGQSFGGATAVSAARNDSRVLGALDYDGSLFGPVVQSGIEQSLLLMGGGYRVGRSESNWEWTYGNSSGWRAQIAVNGSVHHSYMDWPLTLELLGLREQLNETYYASRIGSIAGERMLNIVWTYTAAFFDFALGGERDTILEGPDDDFPDVVFLEGPNEETSIPR